MSETKTMRRCAYEMAIEELTDAAALRRAAILAPSQAEEILRVIRRAASLTPETKEP